MLQHPVFKFVASVLGTLLGLWLIVGGWHLAQRSYDDYNCSGTLDEQAHCVETPIPDPSSSQPSSTMIASNTVPSLPVAPNAATLELSGAPSAALDPIDLLNRERSRAGVGLLHTNALLNQAALAHSQYLVQNHRFAHDEQAGLPGFTGTWPVDRIQATGYGAGEHVGTGEVVATLDGDAADGVHNLMTAIYHRFVMLTPIFQEAGAGVVTNGSSMVLTMEMAVRASTFQTGQPTSLVFYPYNQQASVPTTFLPADETPNPVPEKPRVGFPISLQIAPEHTLVVNAWNLRDLQASQDLPGKTLSASQDPEVTAYEAAFIPWEPLKPSTLYQVNASGSVDGQPFSTQWTFQTAEDARFAVSVDQPMLHPGEQTMVRFSKTTARAWQVTAQSSGAPHVPIHVLQQSEQGVVIQATAGCSIPNGCPVSLTVTDDQGHSVVAALRVLP